MADTEPTPADAASPDGAGQELTTAIPGLDVDLSELLGYVDPAQVRLPLGEMPDPADTEAMDRWLIMYTKQVELTKAGADLRKVLQQTADLAASGALEREKRELEIAEARRKHADAEADAARALVYTFYDGVDEESCKDAIRTLDAWSRREPNRNIKVVLNSPGGFVLDGLALYDFLLELRDRGHNLTVVALGMAASMGSILLQAGTTRVVGRNAFVLLHEVRHGIRGTTSDLKDEVAFTETLENKLLDILTERSTLTAEQIRERWTRRDWWLTAQETVTFGFADQIL